MRGVKTSGNVLNTQSTNSRLQNSPFQGLGISMFEEKRNGRTTGGERPANLSSLYIYIHIHTYKYKYWLGFVGFERFCVRSSVPPRDRPRPQRDRPRPASDRVFGPRSLLVMKQHSNSNKSAGKAFEILDSH